MIQFVKKINKFLQKKPVKNLIDKSLDNNLIDNNAKKIINTLNTNNFEAYLVGGAVRDILLGLKPKDFDIATNATPEQIHKIFKRSRIIGRRFQIVHIVFARNNFIEVSTFRNTEKNTKTIKRDNNFGTIETDALRRDLTINALYYDIKNKQIIDFVNGMADIQDKNINIIGDNNLRFNQDPVRILRAIRFSVKLNFTIDENLQLAIQNNKNLLQNIPAARYFEECLKLFHNKKSYPTFLILIKFDVFKYLFPCTKDSLLIKEVLNNTSARVKKSLPISPAFIFAVFLYEDYLIKLKVQNKKIKSKFLAHSNAATECISEQKEFVSIPKFAINKIMSTWQLQYKLEQKKNIQQILDSKDFRMAYDFLLMRSKSVNPELKPCAKFWDKEYNLFTNKNQL